MAMKVMLKEIEIKKNIKVKTNKKNNLIFLSLLIIIKKTITRGILLI